MMAESPVREWFIRLLTSAATSIVTLIAMTVCAAHAQKPLLDSDLAAIRFDQNLGGKIPLTLQFVDEAGARVTLNDYFSRKPVLLVLGYYECPMLCTLVFNGMVECLGDMRWTIGKEYDVVFVSIDPNETPRLAASKKANYLKRYGRDGATRGWHFLTGAQSSISELAKAIGYHYAYDPLVKQYAHPSGFVVLTPEGKISHYFMGVTFSPRAVFPAIQAAANKSIGERVQDLVLLCFHYRPLTGRFGPTIMTIVRMSGILTVAGLVFLIFRGTRASGALSDQKMNAIVSRAKQAPESGKVET
jgi:protein SCO1/2